MTGQDRTTIMLSADHPISQFVQNMLLSGCIEITTREGAPIEAAETANVLLAMYDQSAFGRAARKRLFERGKKLADAIVDMAEGRRVELRRHPFVVSLRPLVRGESVEFGDVKHADAQRVMCGFGAGLFMVPWGQA